MSQNNHPSTTGEGVEKCLTDVKAQIAACKNVKTALYGAWKAATKFEKPAARAEYDEAANKLKTLYVEQKALQEEIKSMSRKGKKRIATGDDLSRRSPRKKARGCDDDTTTESTTASSNSAMVDLDAYTPTPLESISSIEGQPPFLHGNQLQPSCNSVDPSLAFQALLLEPSVPAITSSSMPATTNVAPTPSPRVVSMINLPSAIASAPLLPSVTDASLPPAASLLSPVVASASLPPAVIGASLSPAALLSPAVTLNVSLSPAEAAHATFPPAVAHAPLAQAVTSAPLPPAVAHAPLAQAVTSAPLPPAVAGAPLLQAVADTSEPLPRAVTCVPAVVGPPLPLPPPLAYAPILPTIAPAPLPLAIATAPLLDAATSNEAMVKLEMVVLPIQKMRATTRGKGSKKDQLKIDKGVTLWHDLTKEQKGKLLYEGKKAFHKWLSGRKPIPFRTRLWARREASFMPELATHSKELAVMTLTTRVGNRMCHFHTRYTNHTSTDAKAAAEDLHPKLTGVPYARTAVKSRIKKETNEEEDEDDGNATDTSTGSYKPRTFAATVYDDAMNCGCSLEDVLLDFFFWKDTVAISPTTNLQEGWCGDMMDPRTRTLVCAILKGQPGIELDWLYEVDGKGKTVSLSNMYHKQGLALKRWYVKREKDANPPESDSEDQSLLPESSKGGASRSSHKAKKGLQGSKTISKSSE